MIVIQAYSRGAAARRHCRELRIEATQMQVCDLGFLVWNRVPSLLELLLVVFFFALCRGNLQVFRLGTNVGGARPMECRQMRHES